MTEDAATGVTSGQIIKEAQTNSVRSLQALYAIVAGLALQSAITNLVDSSRGSIPIRFEIVPVILAFLVTLIPFFHGALRHLDSTYLEGGGRTVRKWALLFDFVLLFVESGLLFALAVLLSKPRAFAWALVALLATDAFWGFVAQRFCTTERQPIAAYRWALVNSVAVIVGIILLLGDRYLPVGKSDDWLSWGILIGCVVRTVVDYRVSWKSYFPLEGKRQETQQRETLPLLQSATAGADIPSQPK